MIYWLNISIRLYTEEAKKLKGKKVLLGRIIKNIEQGWSPHQRKEMRTEIGMY